MEKAINTPRSHISFTLKRLGEFSLFASQLLTRQRQADYQLESGRLDGSLAILAVAPAAALAILGLCRAPLGTCHRLLDGRVMPKCSELK